MVKQTKKIQKIVAQIENNCYYLTCRRKENSNPTDAPTKLTALARS